jgi:hypothetical protein
MEHGQYTTSSADGFEIETNALPLGPPAEPPQREAPPETSADTSPAEAAAPGRDAKGRFVPKGQVEIHPDDGPAEKQPPPPMEAPEGEPQRREPPRETPDQKEPEKPAAKRKPRDDPQARVEQAVGRQREAERRAAELEQRLAALEARLSPRSEEPRRETAAETWNRYKTHPDAPQQEQFASYDDYNAALSVFVADQRFREHASRTQQYQRQYAAQREREALRTTFAGHMDTAIKGNGEWLASIAQDVLNLPTLDALGPRDRPTIDHVIGEELLRTDHPVAVMEYLSDHPDEFQALRSLPPRLVTRRMAVLDARVDAAPATGPAPPVAFSSARPPVKPVTASPVPPSDEPPGADDDDLDRHIRFYNAQERKAGRAR